MVLAFFSVFLCELCLCGAADTWGFHVAETYTSAGSEDLCSSDGLLCGPDVDVDGVAARADEADLLLLQVGVHRLNEDRSKVKSTASTEVQHALALQEFDQDPGDGPSPNSFTQESSEELVRQPQSGTPRNLGVKGTHGVRPEGVGFGPDERGMAFFVSDNRLACYEGPVRNLTGALALRQAGPISDLFRNSRIRVGRCWGAQYGHHGQPFRTGSFPNMQYWGGLDTFYLGVQTWYISSPSMTSWQNEQTLVLERFAVRHSLTQYQVNLAFACTSQFQSPLWRARQGQCRGLTFPGSFIEGHPSTGTSVMCREGPYVHAVRVLATLKSSMSMAFHYNDSVIPQRCGARGFFSGNQTSMTDYCHPPMTNWVSVNSTYLNVRQQYRDMEWNLLSGGFTRLLTATSRFGQEVTPPIDAVGLIVDTTPQCNCAAGSEWYMQNPSQSSCTHSPIRDWWSGWPLALSGGLASVPTYGPYHSTATVTTTYCGSLDCGNYSSLLNEWLQWSDYTQNSSTFKAIAKVGKQNWLNRGTNQTPSPLPPFTYS